MAFVMEKIVEQGILLDFYGPLLTEHQQEICRAAVYEDLSLTEIAEQYGITRQGVHDLLKRCDHTLRGYEEKLGLIEQYRKQNEGLEQIRRMLGDAISDDGVLYMDERRTAVLMEQMEQLTGALEN